MDKPLTTEECKKMRQMIENGGPNVMFDLRLIDALLQAVEASIYLAQVAEESVKARKVSFALDTAADQVRTKLLQAGLLYAPF